MNYKGGKVDKKCLTCRKEFSVYPGSKINYCSKNCYYKSKIGKKQTPQQIEKTRQRMLQNNPFKGKRHSDKTKDKMREAKLKNPTKYWLGKNFLSGELHWNWNGGITPENNKIRNSVECKTWRKVCLQRDRFICQKCGQNGGDIIVHHINNFADFVELRFFTDNGISLCEKCHGDFHKRYGFKNNTKGQILEWLSSLK